MICAAIASSVAASLRRVGAARALLGETVRGFDRTKALVDQRTGNRSALSSALANARAACVRLLGAVELQRQSDDRCAGAIRARAFRRAASRAGCRR